MSTDKKPWVKHACNICKHEFRAVNLMRHIYTHRDTMYKDIQPERLKYCLDNRFPVMYSNENDYIMCLICRKTAHVGGRGLTVKDFMKGYTSVHHKCISCFDTVKDLFEPPKNLMIELPKPVDNKELIELKKQYAELKNEYNDLDDAYDAYVDNSQEELKELVAKKEQLVITTKALIDVIETLQSEYKSVIDLMQTEVDNCYTAIADATKQ